MLFEIRLHEFKICKLTLLTYSMFITVKPIVTSLKPLKEFVQTNLRVKRTTLHKSNCDKYTCSYIRSVPFAQCTVVQHSVNDSIMMREIAFTARSPNLFFISLLRVWSYWNSYSPMMNHKDMFAISNQMQSRNITSLTSVQSQSHKSGTDMIWQ